jgi:hypothetical protein
MASLSPGLSDISASLTAVGPLSLLTEGLVPLNTDLKGEVSVSGMGLDQSSAYSVSVVDNVIYFPYQGETLGIEVNEENLSSLDFSGVTGGMVPLDAGSLAAGGGTLGLETMLGTNITTGLDGAGLDAYITFERQGDMDVMGQTVSPYVFAFDLGAYLASPEFNQMVTQFGPLLGEEFTSVAPMLPLILGGSEGALTITQLVGADNYIHGFTFAFNFSINLGMLLGDPSMAPIAIDVLLDLGMSDFNDVGLASAPSGARLLSPEEAQGIFQAISSGM